MHTFIAMAYIGKDESVFKDYYQSEELRKFYEQERAELIRLEQERRSVSPKNWRQPIIPLFDPTIPPPTIPSATPTTALNVLMNDEFDLKQKQEVT
jgi:hypothetical protein